MTSFMMVNRNTGALQYFAKRTLDYVGATIALVVFLPLFLIVAILIYIEDKGPIFYKQARVGKDGKLFMILKFRSMVKDADKLMTALEVHNKSKDGVLFKIIDDPRITRIGAFIRKYSIDELPQFINILQGEMSIIGPRPYSIRDWKRLPKHQRDRSQVLPGLACYWQVYKGDRWSLSSEEIYQLDKAYIEELKQGSILLTDLSIIFRVFGVLLNNR